MSETAPAKLPKDIAAEKGMVNVQINGTWYEFPRGMRIIDACREIGIIVPHFCYHPKLSVRGSCRMCLVEQGMPPRLAPGQEPSYDEKGFQNIQWMPRAIIACGNAVGENMGIRTEGTLVEKVRRGVMEFLLINHPLDCPICDKAGECLLQENAFDYGQGESRYTDSKTKKPKRVDIGKHIIYDGERCIVCGRCIRFMKEVAKDPVLTFTQRGTDTVVSVFPGHTLDHPYSMNVIDICPVGALTAKDFRHQMRVWFLKQTPTIDVHDGTGINITVGSREGVVYRITPRANNDVNSDWMPDNYRLDYKTINAENRFTQPFALSPHGKQEAITWESALTVAITGLKRFTSDQVAIIASGRSTNEELFLTQKLANRLGITRLDIIPRTGDADDMLISADKNPNTNGAKLILGLTQPGEELARIRQDVRDGKIRALLVIGEDLTQEAGFTKEDLGKLDYLVTTATHPGEMTPRADIILPGVTFAEKYGTMINVNGRLQRLNQAISPVGNSKEDWNILLGLIKELGPCNHNPMPTSAMDIFDISATEVPAFEGLNWGRIGDQGCQIMETGVTIPLIEREKAAKQ